MTASRAEADSLVGDTVKILSKIGLLWKEGRIKPSSAEHLRVPGQDIAEQVGTLLRRCVPDEAAETAAASASSAGRASSEASDAEIAALAAEAEAWAMLALPLLDGHMRDRNLATAKRLGLYYGGARFLGGLLASPELAPERARLVPLVDEALRRSGKTALVDRPRCVMVGCDLHRASIPGTEFCLAHHAIRFSKPASLQDFLDSSVYKQVFFAYCEEHRPHLLPLLGILERCSKLSTSGTRAVMRERAMTVVRRFVAPGAPERLFFLGGDDGEDEGGTAAPEGAGAAAGDGRLPFPIEPGRELEGVPGPLGWGSHLPPSLPESETRPVPSPAPCPLPDARFVGIGGRASALDRDRVARAAATLTGLARDATVRSDVFVGLTSTALAVLDAEFVGSFARSWHFAAWASDNLGLSLPRISMRRLRMLVEKGVTVEGITGGHVRQVAPGILVAVSEAGAPAIGAEVGQPVSLETGETICGAEAEALGPLIREALEAAGMGAADAASAAPGSLDAAGASAAAAAVSPSSGAGSEDDSIAGALRGLGRLGSGGGLAGEWAPEA